MLVAGAALATIGQAIWPALLMQASQDRGTSAMWLISLIAGGVALAGLAISMRARTIGRAMIVVAGLAILIGPVAYDRPAPIPLAFGIICGVLLLAAAAFVGPMPPPQKHI